MRNYDKLIAHIQERWSAACSQPCSGVTPSQHN
jgi:hypothetical protein